MGTPDSDPIAEIRQVNRWVNHTIAYREDSALWHKADYWADARSTLRKRAGDCEDIAIVKYQALIGLGFAPSDVYLTIARDLVRDADHALVVVRHDGRYYLLDDSTDELLDGSEPNDYRPMLSFGTEKWLHGLQPAAATPIYLSRNALSNARSIGINR